MCRTCHETGKMPDPDCNGRGQVADATCNGTGRMVEDGVERVHAFCQGAGRVGYLACGNSGKVECTGEGSAKCKNGWIHWD